MRAMSSFRDAVERGLLFIDREAVLRLIVFHVPIDIDNAFGLFEQIAHLPRQRDASLDIRAVNFGDQRFEHRRARRHFATLIRAP